MGGIFDPSSENENEKNKSRTYLPINLPMAFKTRGVSINEGHITLIRMLYSVAKNCKDFVNPITPCFVAQ